MKGTVKTYNYKTLGKVAERLRADLNDHYFVLLFAYNGTGKTRLSMEFKDKSKKRKKSPVTDTLYYNAFTTATERTSGISFMVNFSIFSIG